MHLAIIVPVLNEADGVGRPLAGLQPLRARGARVVVVDGGSPDGTADIARPLADDVIAAARDAFAAYVASEQAADERRSAERTALSEAAEARAAGASRRYSALGRMGHAIEPVFEPIGWDDALARAAG